MLQTVRCGLGRVLPTMKDTMLEAPMAVSRSRKHAPAYTSNATVTTHDAYGKYLEGQKAEEESSKQ